MKNFAVIGIGGFVAPRHLKAIQETGNRVIAGMDPSDSVGIIDSYFPTARFFTEFERFDRHCEKLRRQGEDKRVHYVSICSPNYLHDAHVRLAMRLQADAICEKPLVINPWNLDQLEEIQQEYGKRVYTVLQLRLHPALIELKKKVDSQNKRTDVELTYVTRRGAWYDTSWKGDENKSGGLVMNIGIHLFDVLMWLFGAPQRVIMHHRTPRRLAGVLELERARVQWFLSVEEDDLPEDVRKKGDFAYRTMKVAGEEVEFSTSFNGLHTRVYQDILGGGGFGIEDARAGIELVHKIRTTDVATPGYQPHPLLKK
jgi:UDP-N-acetyl-2-amino-2-deoxyglucuronate dehydrogenase